MQYIWAVLVGEIGLHSSSLVMHFDVDFQSSCTITITQNTLKNNGFFSLLTSSVTVPCSSWNDMINSQLFLYCTTCCGYVLLFGALAPKPHRQGLPGPAQRSIQRVKAEILRVKARTDWPCVKDLEKHLSWGYKFEFMMGICTHFQNRNHQCILRMFTCFAAVDHILFILLNCLWKENVWFLKERCRFL